MALNLSEVLQQLEATRAQTAQELADVDAIIAIVRQRAMGTTAPPKKNGKVTNGATGKLSPDQVVQMGELYKAGKSVDEIASRFKITTAAVYYYSSSRKWKRGVAPKAEQLSGSVRCNHCGTMTDHDPCRACGKTLTRKF